MRRLQLFIAFFAALATGLMFVTPVLASDVSKIYKDCEANGKLTGHYTRAQLQAALNQMPSEVAEYSSCSDLIQQALLRASHGSGHGGPNSHAPLAGGGKGPGRGGRGGHGAVGKHGHKAGDPKSKYGRTASAATLPGAGIRPDSTGTGNSIPTPLLIVLILLGLTAASGAGVAIRRLLVARHST